MTAPNLDSTAAAEHFFAGATAAGMTHVVISPGSRSTPLAVAADRTPGLTTSVHLDERSAAFAALGQAKASGVPVGLVCTSGTAAANYLPAVSEASLANVSLVAITADRPPEHQHTGVGQSFDQRGLFHRQVRDELSMPVGGEGGEPFTLRAGWRAVATAIELHGPVHVNWPFRLPLEPTRPPIESPEALSRVHPPDRAATNAQTDSFEKLLAHAERPIIVAGPETVRRPRSFGPDSAASEILRFADRRGIPVLADVLSGLRGHDSTSLVPAPALVVEGSTPQPDLVIRLGNTPTAKATRLWWESTGSPQVLIDPLDEWQDPSQMVTHRFRCDADALLSVRATDGDRVEASWRDSWVDAGTKIASIRSEILEQTPLTEAHVAATFEHALDPTDTIVASSSMPIRDTDTFTSVRFKTDVFSNRGINGIDGVAATAIGVSRAHGHGRTVVHLGDVAALHDVGGILDAARHDIRLTLVIPNNDGGGIFSFLPARAALDAEQFRELFHTPHGTNFDFLAGHSGISHCHVDSTETLGAALRDGDDASLSILEVAVTTRERLALQANLLDAVRSQ